MKALKRYDILLALFFFLGALPAQYSEILSLLEEQTISMRHQLRMAWGDRKDLAFSKDVVLVNVDERFFKAYGSYPLRRTDIAAIVANLKALGAKVIAVDMLMDFPSSYGEDPALAKALKDSGNTLLVAQAEFRAGKFERMNYPTAALDQASDSAYTNISSNSALLTLLSRLKIHPEITAERGGWPFAVAATAKYLGVEPALAPGELRLGDRTVPLDHFNKLYIDFPPLPNGTRFLSQSAGISALEFLDISGLDENDREELSYWVRDKLVIIGDTSEVSHDWFDTPVGMVYGVEIIADTIHSLLRGGPVRAANPVAAATATLTLGLFITLAGLSLTNPLARGLVVLSVALMYGALETAVYVNRGIAFPMAYPLVAAILTYLGIEYRHYMLVRDQKAQIAKTFGQYIPGELVDEMNRTGQRVSVGGESREMTVLFSDVRGFTTISEGLPPQQLTVLMNAFLSPMTKVIHQHRGTIDKYMGDAIMAFWGAPLKDADHARHAVMAALEMNRTMDGLAESFLARGWKPIKIGIGLNTGVMSVGNMGSDFRLAYTVMGDAVNLGSRLESLTKQYGVNVMISEYTHAAVPGLVARELDMVRVKGKDTPVRIFEPIGFEGDVDDETLVRLKRYHEAVEAYRSQNFKAARVEFQGLLVDEPERTIYKIYLQRIDHFIDEPPALDWDGVYTHKEK
ncbi:MAG: CHASE2 domain-containing protein [Solirubrobacterales bacterium]